MLLRPRQKQFVERSVRALGEHGNTLGVAPTGAGKTIMLSGVVGRMVGETPKSTGAKACVLAHRLLRPDGDVAAEATTVRTLAGVEPARLRQVLLTP